MASGTGSWVSYTWDREDETKISNIIQRRHCSGGGMGGSNRRLVPLRLGYSTFRRSACFTVNERENRRIHTSRTSLLDFVNSISVDFPLPAACQLNQISHPRLQPFTTVSLASRSDLYLAFQLLCCSPNDIFPTVPCRQRLANSKPGGDPGISPAIFISLMHSFPKRTPESLRFSSQPTNHLHLLSHLIFWCRTRSITPIYLRHGTI